MEDDARNAASAYKDARALAEKLKAKPQSAANDALIKQVDELAPPTAEAAEAGAGGGGGGRGGGRGGRGGGRGGRAAAAAAVAGAPPAEAPTVPNLSNIGAEMVAAAQGMQGSEMPPTAAELHACSQQQAAYTVVMAKWTALKAKVNGPAAAGGRGAAKQ
jgi:hypothetical protein